ncbi:MAG: Cellulose synthase catalytic subunit (UDP-forming) [Microgenomates bacterium OLB22]|nr:MAG: Cellulose synthase catalytic subunit (UDP-forming) [Microgenomates bacterium OLB22]
MAGNSKNTLIEYQHSWVRELGVYLYMAIAGWYLLWRLQLTLTLQGWLIPLIFLADIYMSVTTVIFLFTSRRSYRPQKRAPLHGVSVDILIPTYNEALRIVEMTARAAKQVRGVTKVWILDDGNRHNIKKLATELGVEYLARTTNEHAKAGNLNNALPQSTADFVLCLDCDHIPLPDCIERLSGYFRDTSLGFVQTPQVFYNRDSIQHQANAKYPFWNEQSMFYEAIQPAKNGYNAAFFCGSGALIRRAALDSVGGFATGTATEDIHTALRLHAQGWSSLFITDRIAYGLAASDLTEYHKQRVRWGAGSLGLLFRSPDSPLVTKGLSLAQRICYIYSTSAYAFGWFKLLYLLAPIITLFSYRPLTESFVLWYAVTNTTFIMFSYGLAWLYSRGTYQFPYTERYDYLNMFGHWESIKGIIKIQKKFGVSLKLHKKENGAACYIYGLLIDLSLFLATMHICALVWWETQGLPLFTSTIFIASFWNIFNLFFLCSTIIFVYRFSREPVLKHQFTVGESWVWEGKSIYTISASLEGAYIVAQNEIAAGRSDWFTRYRTSRPSTTSSYRNRKSTQENICRYPQRWLRERISLECPTRSARYVPITSAR